MVKSYPEIWLISCDLWSNLIIFEWAVDSCWCQRSTHVGLRSKVSPCWTRSCFASCFPVHPSSVWALLPPTPFPGQGKLRDSIERGRSAPLKGHCMSCKQRACWEYGVYADGNIKQVGVKWADMSRQSSVYTSTVCANVHNHLHLH